MNLQWIDATPLRRLDALKTLKAASWVEILQQSYSRHIIPNRWFSKEPVIAT